jgi:alpha-2-macroglobulin
VSARVDKHWEAAELNHKNLWTARMTLPMEAVSGKPVRVEVKASGKKTVMAIASMGFLSDSAERMTAKKAGLEVERHYFRVAMNGTRQLLADGEKVATGDLIEVVLKVTADGERNYVHLRDPIPAGLEPLYQLSGYEGGAYRESRGGETDFFFSSLSPWNSVQRYQLRAVTKGSGTALPTRAECMYALELFGQSGLRVIEVE